MPRIRFTATPKLPRDMAHLGYHEGTEVDLSEDQANRWLRRGVATVIEPEPQRGRFTASPPSPATPTPTPTPAPASPVTTSTTTTQQPVEIPSDWETQHHMARLALARRLAPDATIADASAADDLIRAEVKRRAAV